MIRERLNRWEQRYRQTIESFYICRTYAADCCHLNCATGPEFMQEHIRALSNISLSRKCYPNAGLPDEEGQYHETPDSLAKISHG